MKILLLVPVKVCSSHLKRPKKLPKINRIYLGFALKVTKNYYFLNSNSLFGVHMTDEVNKIGFV